MNEPSRPGIYLFTGIRHMPLRGGIVSIRDICEVRHIKWRVEEELAVYFLGRSQPFAVKHFEGTWEPLRIDFGGVRQS